VAVDVRDRLGLISLDYGSAAECVAAAEARRLGHVELYLTGPELGVTPRRGMVGPVRVHALSCLVKLAQAESDLPEQADLLRRCIDLAADTGVTHVGFMYGGSALLDRSDARHRFLERLEPLAARARDAGVTLLVENVFSRSPAGDLDSVDAILAVFERLDPATARLTFDAGNLTIGGEEAYPYGWRRLRAYAGGVHLKDVTRYRPADHGPDEECRPLLEHRTGRYVTVAVGDGALNALGFAREVLADPAAPPLLLEPFRDGPSREKWLDVSIARLEALTAGAWA
jgi:sugar phosphate isomerase/epimerase